MNKNFKYPVNVYNQRAAQEIVPFVMNLVNPKSVVDVGCGIGTWLKIFKENGVQSVVGLDGAYHEKNVIMQNLSDTEFVEVNLEDEYTTILNVLHAKHQAVNRLMFDLVISLEVAEHLHEKYADSYIDLLTTLSGCILFSAAIPKQGGDGHVNEQWPTYWVDKFAKKGYKVYDVIRPRFWNNVHVETWYKQNMLLFVKEGEHYKDIKNRLIEQCAATHLLNIVHPDLFMAKISIQMGIRPSINSLFLAILRRLKSYV